MITLHYLVHSRSQRIVWLLEELGVEYELKRYERNKKTNLAPDELKKIHPLGRAPVIEDDGLVIAESGAIIEHLIERYDTEGKFKAENKHSYLFWVHFAEASLMPPLVTNMVLNKGKEKVGFPISIFINKFVDAIIAAYFGPNLATSLDFIEAHLSEHHGFDGESINGADFQMIFPLEAVVGAGRGAKYPAITAYVKRIHQREAYQSGLVKSGEYAYASVS